MSPSSHFIGLILIFTGYGYVQSFYLPDTKLTVSLKNTSSNQIDSIGKFRQSKSKSINDENLNLNFSPDGIIENVHHVVKDFQDEKIDKIIDDEEILYESKSLPLNINYEKSSLQHQELIFGPSHLKIDLKREDNNYKIPNSSTSSSSFGPEIKLRSLEDSVAQGNVSNEITNTKNSNQKSIDTDTESENQNPIDISITNLEDNIRNEVHEEIEKEKSFETSIIEVLSDIPEPEIRETLKQDLLDSNYPEKQKEIIESKASNEDQIIDFIAQNDKNVLQIMEKTDNQEEISTLTGDNFSDKTSNNQQLLEAENLPVSKVQDSFIVLYKNVPLENQFQDTTTEKLDFRVIEKIPEENFNLEISEIQVETQQKSSSTDLDFNSTVSEDDTTITKSLGESLEQVTEQSTEMQTENRVGDDNHLKTISTEKINENEPENTNHFNLVERRSDDEVIENKIQIQEMIFSQTTEQISLLTDTTVEEESGVFEQDNIKTSQIKNTDIGKGILVEENISQKSLDADHIEIRTDQIDNVMDNSKKNSENQFRDIESVGNQDDKFDKVENSESTSESRYLREFYTTVVPYNSNENKVKKDDTIKEIERQTHNESSQHIESIKFNKNLLAPLVLPESGIQITEIYRSIHGRTTEDKNLSDIPLKFPNSGEIIPVLSAFSSSNSDTDILPVVVNNENIGKVKNLDRENISSFNEVKVADVTEIQQINLSEHEMSTNVELNEKKTKNDSELKSLLDEIDLTQSVGLNDSETVTSFNNHFETKTNETFSVRTSLEDMQNENKDVLLDTSGSKLKEVQLEFDISNETLKNDYFQQNQTEDLNSGILLKTIEENLMQNSNNDNVESVTIKQNDLLKSSSEEIEKMSNDTILRHENFESSTNIITLKVSGDETLVEKEKKSFENEGTSENVFIFEEETTPFDEASYIKPKAIELLVTRTKEEDTTKESNDLFIPDKSAIIVQSTSNDKETEQHNNNSESSSEEESDSSEEDDKYEYKKKKFKNNSHDDSEEPLKLNLYDSQSKSIESDQEIENDDSTMSLDLMEQNETPSHLTSSRTNQGRSLSFDTISTDQISQQYLQNQLSSLIIPSTPLPLVEILSDEIIDGTSNNDHNVFKRPGVIKGNDLQKLKDENSKQIISDDVVSDMEVTTKSKVTVNYDGDNDDGDKGSMTTRGRTLNSDDEEVQTALVDTLIEMAELTTDINRHILSFRTPNKTNSDIHSQIIDSTTIENSLEMDENSMGEVRPAEIFEEFIQESSINIMVVVLISIIGLITIIAIIFMAFFKFKNQTVTLDVQIERQQENKHTNEQNQQHQQEHQQKENHHEKDAEELTSITTTTIHTDTILTNNSEKH